MKHLLFFVSNEGAIKIDHDDYTGANQQSPTFESKSAIGSHNFKISPDPTDNFSAYSADQNQFFNSSSINAPPINQSSTNTSSQKPIRQQFNSSTSGFKFLSKENMPRSSRDLLSCVQCRLETKDLWDKFFELGTEMIITKSGRSESLLNIHNLLDTNKYCVY